MKRKSRLRLQVFFYALCVVASTVFIFESPQVFAQDKPADGTLEDESLELERFSVTGSRIKRTEIEGALPVMIFNREDLERSGESSAADFIRSLPVNSFGSWRAAPGNPAQGESHVDLHGVGSNRSLVLIDGRRLPKSPMTTSSQNIGLIPLAAIERVEVLTDGASAIYGSDAIGGVINIITRDHYRGVELMLGSARSENGESDRDHGYVVGGLSSDRGNIMLGVSFEKRNMSLAGDFPWIEPGESIFSNNFTTVDPTNGFDNFNFTDLPGGCADSEAFFLARDPWSLSGDICLYDYARVASTEVSLENRAAFLKAEHDVGSRWQVWLQGSYYILDSFGRFAPYPSASLFSDFPLAFDSPNNPTNPASAMYDPAFGPNVPVNWWHRFESLGNRDTSQESAMTDFRFGMTGWVGTAEIDFGLRGTWNKTETASLNILLDDVAQQYIADGRYDLQHPSGNPDDVLNAMKTRVDDRADYDQFEAFASVGWDLWETRAGPVRWLVGGEFRREDYSAEDNYFTGENWSNDRNVTSLFFETLVPLLEPLELTVAGRYDNYSDYGSNFSPKLSLRWRPAEAVILRASWGEGFRAPELAIDSASITGVGIAIVNDPQSCAALNRPSDCSLPVPVEWVISSALTSEQSEQYSLGLVWQPSAWFNGTVDYYNIAIDGLIQLFEPEEVLDRDIAGDPLPADIGVVRDPASGFLMRIYPGYGNEGQVDTSGVDVNAMFNFELGSGSWTSSLFYSRVLEYLINGGRDRVGDPDRPQFRIRLSNVYEVGQFAFTWNINYIASQFETVVGGVGEGRIPNWTTHDLQATWYASWDGRLTAGAQNVLDELPKVDGSGSYQYGLYNAYGRVLYLRYTQTF